MSFTARTCHIGVDTGGTFTDLVEIGSDGTIFFDKAFSTPAAPEQGIIDVLRRVAEARNLTVGAHLAATERFGHGTTVSTNALIQRHGARVGLLTTRGFEDTLEIGRGPLGRVGGLPQAKAMDFLHTEPPLPLVSRNLIRGIGERITATGTVIAAADEADIEAEIRALLDAGMESLAVCFLWSFRNPAHEHMARRVAIRIAPDLSVSLSSDVAPRMGEFERMVATVVNAFIGPVTGRYVSSLQRKLQGLGFKHPIQLMKSSGGVVLPETVVQQSISTINSGPIGGLVAARHFGELFGHDRIITADMGGTSFDVGLIVDGVFEEQTTPFIDQGLPVNIPAIKVVTIGAGGGSIAWSDGRRLMVGPQSAGADPGPACYGRGGQHPTVTDSLVMLGIIDPGNFFGGRYTLSRQAAEDAVRRDVARPLSLEPMEAAAGIYEVVTARMGDLIRKVTVESGWDPREFCLLAYGGATAAHCAVFARQLGLGKVIIPYTAPVFSALGIALSDVLYSHSRSAPLPLDDSSATLEAINEVLAGLEERVRADIVASGLTDPAEVMISFKIDMRYRGQMNEVSLPWVPGKIAAKDIPQIREAFETYYRKRFGRGTVSRTTPLEIISFRADAVKRINKPPMSRLFERDISEPPAPAGCRRVYQHATGWVDARVYAFENLRPGPSLSGPAVIERNNTTVWLPPGTSTVLDAYGNLEITMAVGQASTAVAGHKNIALDPVTFEVVKHRLWQINDEQSVAIRTISSSPIVVEGNDFNVGLFTADGQLTTAGIGSLVHVGTMGEALRSVIKLVPRIRSGDVYLTNDPFLGALHQNDVVLLSPLFWQERIVMWVGNVLHHPDVGGVDEGSFCINARNLYQDPPRYFLKLVDEGELAAEVERTFVSNSRLPEMVALDLKAQLGAINAAQSRLIALIEERGVEVVENVARQSVEVAEQQVREQIARMPQGIWTGEAFMDGARVGDSRIHKVMLRLSREGDTLHFDFTGSSPQVDAAVNSTYHATVAGAIVPLYSFLCQGDIDWNDGVKRCVRVTAPEGTVVNATFPAPVSICTVGFRWLVTVAASQALAKMFDASPGFRDRVCSSWNVSSNCNNLFGVGPDGRRVGALLSDHRGGGAGARSFADGFSHAGQITSSSSTLGNVEGAEWKLPLLYVFRRQLSDSGGAGRFRGGLTAAAALVPYGINEFTLNATNTAGTEASNAHGLDGGYPGAGSQSVIVRTSRVWDLLRKGRPPLSHTGFAGAIEYLPSKASTRLQGNDVLMYFAPGGGGYGDPLDREPARVACDVAEGRITPECAKRLYGVIVDGRGSLDALATERMHAAILEERRRGDIRPWERDDVYSAPPESVGEAWSVGLNIVMGHDGVTLVCAACNQALTTSKGCVSVRSTELGGANPWAALRWNGRSPHFYLEEVSCSRCGKLLQVREVYRSISK